MKKVWMFAWVVPVIFLISWLYQQSQFNFSRFELASNKIESFYRYSSEFEQSVAQQIIANYPDYRHLNTVFSQIYSRSLSLKKVIKTQFPSLIDELIPFFDDLDNHLKLQENTLLSFYEKNSVLRNTQSFLLNEASDSEIITQTQRINLLESLVKSNASYLSEHQDLTQLKQELEVSQTSTSIDEVALILKHIEVYERHIKQIEQLLGSLTSSDVVKKMRLIDDRLNLFYIEAEGTTSKYKNLLFLASIFLLTGLVLVIYRLDTRSKQRQKLLDEKFKMQEMMIQSEKMLSVGGLAAGMAHEINNPLAGIVQNLQVIKNRLSPKFAKNFKTAETCNIEMGNLDEYLNKRDIHNMMDAVMDSGQRAARIVNNTLSFSRKGVGIRTNEQINDVIDQTINLSSNDYDLKKKYDFRKIILKKKYASHLPSVSCEASEIQQVLFNIFKNGAQAMMSNDAQTIPEFVITTSFEEEKVVMQIKDNGPGMPEKVRKRIFEPFFTTKSPGVGTGLGLSVSYFIITKNHGGEMTVDSAEGKGTSFTIRLSVDSKPS